MRNLILVSLTGATLAGPAFAQVPSYGEGPGPDRPEFYAKLFGGLNAVTQEEWDLDGAGNLATDTVDFDYDAGFVGGGALGMKIHQSFRVEAELAYRINEADEEEIGRLEGTPLNVDGELGLTSVMVNGFYDFMPGETWRPYLGAGIGVGVVDADDIDETAFAYQFLAGISRDLNNGQAIGVEAGYFGTTDIEGDDGIDDDESQVEFDYGSAQARIFWRIGF